MKKTISVTKECLAALGIVLNVVGAFLAMSLHLPIYVDSLGTILNAALLGPVWGALTGVLGSLVSGLTFDIYSLYFAPAQIFTGLMTGLFFKHLFSPGKKRKGSQRLLYLMKMLISTFIAILPTGIISAIINATVFNGITSAGSSFIVQLLTKMGMSLTASCFVVQIFTDYADKLIAIGIAATILTALRSEIKERLR